MNKKITALSIVALTILAATIGAFAVTAFATPTASPGVVADNAVTDDSSQSTTTQNTNQVQVSIPQMMERGFGAFGRGPGGREFGRMGGMGNIEISSEYTAKINSILGNDTDVANLTTQGYNVTAIRPIVKTVIQGDGTITSQATTAIVFMQGTSGYATVHIDIANAKVTEIVTVTRNVIDKSSS